MYSYFLIIYTETGDVDRGQVAALLFYIGIESDESVYSSEIETSVTGF